MANCKPDPARAADEVTGQQLATTVAGAGRQREATVALDVEASQARRRARALRDDANAILASAAAVIESVLADRGIALAEPVQARFQTKHHGSCGIELTVRLEDPSRAALARSAITEHLGGESRCDSLVVV